uniref:CD209 antigen-like protein A n=1 Tax=Nannospalax galili TaxID=1026970 RepID=A0A8C6QCD9_NANGA
MAGEPEPQQPGSHAEEVTFGGQRFTEKDPEGLSHSPTSLPECLTGVPWLLLLLFSLGLFSVLLLATLVQAGSRIPESPPGETQDDRGIPSLGEEVPPQQIPSSLEQIQQQLIQINASLGKGLGPESGAIGLYCPCPSDWELFQGSRYLFSWTLGSWQASVSACQDLGAHLVIVNSIAEQSFLNHCHIRKNELSSISLREDKRGFWLGWLSLMAGVVCSFWKEGEPNNDVDEDCVKLREDRWNDSTCTAQNFWVCEQPAAPC